jgi:hypothetical protein
MNSRSGGYPFREVLAEVRANLAILESCPGPHDFQEIKDGKVFFAKWRCATCGGVVDSAAAAWYTRGLAHAAKAPADAGHEELL